LLEHADRALGHIVQVSICLHEHLGNLCNRDTPLIRRERIRPRTGAGKCIEMRNGARQEDDEVTLALGCQAGPWLDHRAILGGCLRHTDLLSSQSHAACASRIWTEEAAGCARLPTS